MLFQSTHPHGVRLVQQGDLTKAQAVSIHAPTRGATVSLHCQNKKQYVSIHAPTRGATRPDHDKLPDHIKFQSTHPHGVRPSRWCPASSKRRSFNPRTHTGCDAGFNATCAIYWRFQSTHPHGVRLETRPIVTFYIRFQSTHPHGVRRVRRGGVRTLLLVSIHAPTRGATCERCVYYTGISNVSIHAPTRGATVLCLCIIAQKKQVSIHAPTRGATSKRSAG